MTVRNKIRLIVYRMHEKGLEILLLKPEEVEQYWSLLQASDYLETVREKVSCEFIEFESEGNDGQMIKTIAIEGDWHDIPRLRSLLKHDVHIVKNKIWTMIPELEKGTYVLVRDAFKKVLPNEYKALKQLKEIIFDRNTVRNI
ncbi:MAG: hypothetical protein IPJ43_10730 [Saprospiraceae bacterium]|nr:hypothetical protein [Saprospiraceae bacterium]MBK7467251.1 hypothetical protein [Saprospiraceae bacterium]MBK9995127.1 hypothetical protein [Saprospiraceae bacterium]